jgi:hypothetical protein
MRRIALALPVALVIACCQFTAAFAHSVVGDGGGV